MKFALFLLASWTENDAAHQRRIYHEALEQVRYAEALGFDAVWIAEHHSSRYGIFPSLMPILAHIAAQTTTIRLGAGVSVLPFHHPIRLAEEAAMVDVLSDGRLNFGVGREWRFLGLKRLLPSVRELAAVVPAGEDTASGVACTLVARSGPVGSPRGDWRSH